MPDPYWERGMAMTPDLIQSMISILDSFIFCKNVSRC